MVRDTKIDDLNKALENVDTSTLTTLSTTNTNVLEIFSDRISTVTNSTSDDNWDDAVKTGINDAITNIVGSINDVIASCTYIANSKSIIDNLKTLCSDYVTEYDKYDNMGPVPIEDIEYTDSEGNKKTKKNPDYVAYINRKNAFVAALPKLATEVHRLEEAVKNYFKAIDLTTNTINGDIYVEGSGDIQFDYSKYFDGRMDIESEGWVDSPAVTETVNAENKTVDRHSEGVYEIQYEDGSEVEANRTEDDTYQDINGDGTVDDTDKLIYQKIHDEGTFTDEKGNVYGYLHDEESDTIGLVSASTTLTNQETGDTVYENEQERLGAYKDAFGIDYVEGEETTSQNGNTTHTRTVSWGNGTDSGGKSYSYTINDADPACGECVDQEGKKYEYFKEDGVIYERVDGGEAVVHEPYYAKFTITDENGKSLDPPVSIKVDVESRLDQLMIQSYLDDGNLKCNYPSGQGSARIGQLFAADETAVYDAWTGEGYQYHIEYEK